eukprot:scaffold131137_cov31-Tisochrysis_lutea.AAC.4
MASCGSAAGTRVQARSANGANKRASVNFRPSWYLNTQSGNFGTRRGAGHHLPGNVAIWRSISRSMSASKLSGSPCVSTSKQELDSGCKQELELGAR